MRTHTAPPTHRDHGDDAWFSESMPQCAICGHSRRGPRTQRHLTHGVSVWLCAAHGSAAYLERRGGKEFAERLAQLLVSAGMMNERRRDALRTHIRRVQDGGGPRIQPGSYAWAALRREAQRRFAAGEGPRALIEDLRREYGDGAATFPSTRTIRRWLSEIPAGSAVRAEARPRQPATSVKA